jgi:hypothetical protein
MFNNFYFLLLGYSAFLLFRCFRKICFRQTPKKQQLKRSISVIVCAKMKKKNVINFIPMLAEQNYPNFEIVLIDDASIALRYFENLKNNTQYPFGKSPK